MTSSDMNKMILRPFVHELILWVTRNQDKVDLQPGPKWMEFIVGSVKDKDAHSYFKLMSPPSALIPSPSGAIVYDVEILR